MPDAASLPRLSQAYPTPFASAAGAVLVCMATLSKWPPPLMLNEKNWSVVRRLVGYARLEPLALPALERLHRLAREYMNFLHPVCNLVSRTRVGPQSCGTVTGATRPTNACWPARSCPI